jgi:hypothetical protein
MFKDIRLESLENSHNESSISVKVWIAEKVFFSVLTLVGFFFAFLFIVMSTVGGSSPSSTFGGTKGIRGVSPGSRPPFGVEPRPEDFFFWELILKKLFRSLSFFVGNSWSCREFFTVTDLNLLWAPC